MGTLTNSEDPDEMPHDAAFHQGLHCLLSQNQSSEKEKSMLKSSIRSEIMLKNIISMNLS